MGPTVFFGYDRVALDREYDNRAKVPAAADHLDRWSRESAAARAELPCRLDLAYGAQPGETLDVFPAPGPAPAPVQVFIHGGYWQRLDRRDCAYVARAFRPAGAATVVVNYALVPSVDLDELVRQCRAAVVWVYRHATDFGGDPERIFVSGHSAGGHLVAMLLATDWPAFAGLGPDVIKGGAGISGLYDLEPIRLSFVNDVLNLSMEDARRLSPVHLVPARGGPLLLAVGDMEGCEYLRQTDDMAAAWRRRGLPCQVLRLSGHDHFSIVTALGDPASPLARAIHRQMGLAAADRT